MTEIWFHQRFHLVLTDSTFHVTERFNGRWVSRDASGSALAGDTYTLHITDQGTGFPRETCNDTLEAVGRTVEGDPVRVTIGLRYTINTSGELTAFDARVDCDV